MSSPKIAVFGATGVVGRRICSELAAAGAPFSIASRHAGAVAKLAREVPATAAYIAEAADAASLQRAFAGHAVVIDAAGPLRETAGLVLGAALAAGAHYLDAGGEQVTLRDLHERHESTARHAGLIAMPGGGLDCVIGDLAAAWAAARLDEVTDPGPVVRDAPAARLAEDRPLDEIAVSYVFDDLVLSAGSQRALFGALGTRTLVWHRDRWEAAPAGAQRRINAGPELGGERTALAYAGGDPITVPRHVAVRSVASYVSMTRRPAVATALGLLSRALPFVPRAASSVLAPYAAPDADYARTRLAVVVQVRRGFSTAQIVVRGSDLYRATAATTAWCARQLSARTTGGPLGMRAPAELFRAEPALREIANAAGLAIDPSFG